MKIQHSLIGLALCLFGLEEVTVRPAIAVTPVAPLTIAQAQGWKVFQGRGVELELPQNFQGGSPSDDQSRKLIEGIKALGPSFAQIASLVEQSPTSFSLIAVDPKPNTAGGVTNVLVAAEQVPANVSLQTYLASLGKFLPSEVRVVEQKTVTLKGKPAGRLVTEASVGRGRIRQLIYVIPQGQTVWTVGYSTGAEEYARRLSTFEQSIQTFKGQISQTR